MHEYHPVGYKLVFYHRFPPDHVMDPKEMGERDLNTTATNTTNATSILTTKKAQE